MDKRVTLILSHSLLSLIHPSLQQTDSSILLHSHAGRNFYKVPVAHGEYLFADKVAETCENAGMKALYFGNEGCSYNNISRCVITEKNLGCGSITAGRSTLTEAICDVGDPKKCNKLWGVFNYMFKWTGSACGIQEDDYCTNGKGKMSTSENTYYALCTGSIVQCEVSMWTSWSTCCKGEAKRKRVAISQGECQNQTLSKACSKDECPGEST